MFVAKWSDKSQIYNLNNSQQTCHHQLKLFIATGTQQRHLGNGDKSEFDIKFGDRC